jgi:Ca2+-binding EF-hand superfamily protein
MCRTATPLLGLLALSTLACAALAQDQPRGEQRPAADLFGRLDANGDGVVTADEIPQERRGFFERLLRTADRNGDGKLTREEFTAAQPDRPRREGDQPSAERPDQAAFPRGNIEEFFRRLDRNGDGKIGPDEVPEGQPGEFVKRMIQRADRNGDGAATLEEIRAAAPAVARGAANPLFAALDRNGDGKITAEELSSAAEIVKQLDRDGDGAISLEEVAPRFAAPGGANAVPFLQRLQQADRNGDGKLSKDEVPEPLRPAFERLDRNGDGVLDADELRAAAERFRRGTGDNP